MKLAMRYWIRVISGLFMIGILVPVFVGQFAKNLATHEISQIAVSQSPTEWAAVSGEKVKEALEYALSFPTADDRIAVWSNYVDVLDGNADIDLSVWQKDALTAQLPRYWNDLAFRRGQYEVALRWSRLLTRLQPEAPKYWYQLALAFRRLGDEEAVADVVSQALQYLASSKVRHTIAEFDSGTLRYFSYSENNIPIATSRSNGKLSLSYENDPTTRQIAAVDIEPFSIISGVSELEMPVKTNGETLITIDLLIDDQWHRPVAYSSYPADEWVPVTIPVVGDLLQVVRIAISEQSTGADGPQIYSAEIAGIMIQ